MLRIEGHGPRASQLLAFITRPIDIVHSTVHADIVLSAHAHNKYYELVMIVNNASDIHEYLAAI